MSFALYIGGVAILIGGLIYGAVLLNTPYPWIAASSLVLLGGAVLTGVAVTRHKDPA